MNIGVLLLVFAIAIAAIMGLAYVGSRAPVVGTNDSYGIAMDNNANISQNLTGNITSTGSQIGGGAIFFVAGLIGVVVLGALVYAATGKTGSGGFKRGG